MLNARRLSSSVMLLLVLALALLQRGCLQAEESDLVRYDPQHDEFHLLMIQRGIQGDNTDDLHYLEAFYKNRDHLIMPIMLSGGWRLDLRLLRLSDRTFAITGFTNAPSTLDPINSPVSLNQITITPGTFFVEGKESLGYYHAITIPGKTIDGALEQLSIAAQPDEMLKSLQDELNRRQTGAPTHTWDELTTQAIRSIDESSTDTAKSLATQSTSDQIDPLTCFDDASLHNLLAAVSAKSLRIKRAGPLFSVVLPLDSTDSHAVASDAKKLARHLHKLVIKPNTDSTDVQEVERAIVGAIAISAQKDGLAITLDPIQLTNSMPKIGPSSLLSLMASDDAKKAPHAPIDTLQFVRYQKLPLDETLTV